MIFPRKDDLSKSKHEKIRASTPPYEPIIIIIIIIIIMITIMIMIIIITIIIIIIIIT